MKHLDTRVLFRRALAFFMDLLLVFACFRIAGLWNGAWDEALLAPVVGWFAYRVICDAYGGRTLAKLLLRIRTVKTRAASTDGVGPWGALVRNLLIPLDVSMLSSVVGLIVLPLLGGRRLGDLVSGTVVVSERSLREGAPVEQTEAERDAEGARRIAGERGEAQVAGELSGLCRRGQCYLFNKLPYTRSGDIDHVLVGPFGVVVVETKANKGEVLVSGGEVLVDGAPLHREPLGQLAHQSRVLSEQANKNGGALRHAVCKAGGVRGFVCFPRAASIAATDGYAAGSVVGAGGLSRAVPALPAVLSAREVEAAADAVRAAYGTSPAARP